jgi:hypothetical protein
MNTIRKVVYAALLTISALNLAPGQASAQDASGTFTLAHEVHWQNAIVPAGEYRFTVGATGPLEVLTLRSLSAHGSSFMLPVKGTADSQAADLSQIVLVPRSGVIFVSTMQLPESGMTLHFDVPSGNREMAQAVATSPASAH